MSTRKPTDGASSAARPMSSRRSYGTGSLYVLTDRAGRETWYGHWRTSGRQVKRRIGPKRGEGTRDGLTRRQAEAELRRLIGEVRVTAAPGERLTVEDVGRRYLLDLERRGRKKATLTAVESALRFHLAPFFAAKAIDSVKPEDVENLVTLMESKGVGPKSIRNYVGTLSAIYTYAGAPRRRWATSNPCVGLELPATEASTEIRFLELDEVEALVSAAQAGPYERIDRALYLTAAMTGLRQGELIALRWRDVDWRAGRVRVRQNYVLGEFGTPKSRRSTRSVPLADRVAGELERLYQASGHQGDDDLVFAHPVTGGPLNKAEVLRRYRKALAGAQLEESRVFHDLRHTFGTRMAAAGVAMRTLQEWMGHRDLATTLIYADYAPSAQEAALVESAFAAPAASPAAVLAE